MAWTPISDLTGPQGDPATNLVQSVNGKTGTIVLVASDVGAAAASHTHTVSQISDATTTGRSVLTAASQAAARTAIGAGTSSLGLGTTSSTARAGNWVPSKADVGLGNVDNTSDANKPLSTAAINALVAKVDDTEMSLLKIQMYGAANRSRKPVCSVYIPSNTSVLNGTDTTLNMSIDFDPDAAWKTNYYLVPVAGFYRVSFHVTFMANGNGARAGKIMKNGTNVTVNSIGSDVSISTGSAGEGTPIDVLSNGEMYAAGDKIYFSVWQNSGGALNLETPSFGGVYTGAVIEFICPP